MIRIDKICGSSVWRYFGRLFYPGQEPRSRVNRRKDGMIMNFVKSATKKHYQKVILWGSYRIDTMILKG
jgi:hypothetical protein